MALEDERSRASVPDRTPWPGMARVLDTVTVLVAVGTAFVAVAMFADLVTSLAVRAPAPSTEAARPAVVLSASQTPAPAASALPSPTPTKAPPITATRYVSGGHPYAGLEVPAGTVVAAPLDGVVEVKTYQLIGGSVRVGSNVSSLPFYPYITVVSVDRRMTYRPGELGADVEVLVQDGQQVRAGAPLFRQLGTGRSSWATFYDPAAPFQVVVSLQAVPSGVDLDPLSFF